jgi:hypothetical protein
MATYIKGSACDDCAAGCDCTFSEVETDDNGNSYNYDVTGQFVFAQTLDLHFDHTPFIGCGVGYRIRLYANSVLIYDSGTVCNGTDIDTTVAVPAGTVDIDVVVDVSPAGAETDWLFDISCV